MNTHKRLLLVTAAVMLISLLAPLAAAAQSGPALTTLAIEIWPEFDRPTALVLLSGELDPAVALPATLSLPIPEAASVNAVAYPDPSGGGLLTLEYTREGGSVTFTLDQSRVFWVEYYDPALQKDGSQRTFAMTLVAPADVNTVEFKVQTPAGADNLAIEPAEGVQTNVGQYGLTYLNTISGPFAAGETLQFSFTYEKSGDSLTADSVVSAPPVDNGTDSGLISPPPADNGAGDSPSVWLIGILLLVGIALIGSGVYWYLQSTGALSPRGRTSGKARTTSAGSGFCTQCGKAIQRSDRFCRHCGTELR